MRDPNFHVRNLLEYDLIRYKVRLAGAKDPGPIALTQSRSASYKLEGIGSSNAKANLDGHEVQQIDFTDGGKNNKINPPNMGSSWNDDNTIEYIDSHGRSHTLVNLGNQACFEVEDTGGIDGSPPAKIRAFFETDPLNPYGSASLFIYLERL